MRREQYGRSSERRARLIDQMELQLEELEADATADEIAAERVAAQITNVSAFERRRLGRKLFPEHLPRERLVIEAPEQCACCGSARMQPIHDLIRAHVLAAERLHGDDTTVPLLARGATKQAR